MSNRRRCEAAWKAVAKAQAKLEEYLKGIDGDSTEFDSDDAEDAHWTYCKLQEASHRYEQYTNKQGGKA